MSAEIDAAGTPILVRAIWEPESSDRWLRGLAAGWVVYMTVLVVTAYDGLPSIILQPIIAAVLAGIMSLIAILAGWPLHATRLKETWDKLGRWTLLPAAVGLIILSFGKQLGLTHTIAAIASLFFG